MSVKVALQADVCYNKHINIVLPERCWSHPQAWTNLSWRFAMDTLPQNTPQKQCTGPCGRTLPATPGYFHRDKGKKDGLASRCKQCASQYEKERWKNPEHREYMRSYRSRPYARERRLEQNRAFDNSPHGRKWNREYAKKYNKEYGQRPEVRKADRTNCHNYRAHKRAVLGTHTPEQIQEQLKRQKRKCYYCSTRFVKVKGQYVYHIDHTFPLSRVAGTDIPANSIDYLVLACPTCNISKKDKFPWEFPEGGRLL